MNFMKLNIIFLIAFLGIIRVCLAVIDANFEASEPFVSANSLLKPNKVRNYVLNEAKKAGIYPDKVLRLINCECRTWNIACLGDHSNSRGIFHFSRLYHPEISDKCAFSASCSTKMAIKIIKKRGFGEWSCNNL